jgi:DNA modification methylase
MVSPGWKNKLFYGDNLTILRKYRREIPDESVDLIYLDPPFNSNASYNVLFRDRSGKDAASQLRAFSDTWQWHPEGAASYFDAVEHGPVDVSKVLQAFRTILGDSTMLAYLSMMAPRLVELRRVLKPTGSIYLHCDPSASHYLKLLMDAVFGPQNFRNEIIWKRTGSHNSAKRFGPVHDVIHYYVKSDDAKWNQQCQPYGDAYKRKFGKIDEGTGMPFQDVALTGPSVRHGPSGQPWRGFDPTASGRHWQPASYVYMKYKQITGEELNQYPLIERLDQLDKVGLIYWPKKKGGQPRYKQFLADAAGVPLQDVWTDIDVINSQAEERLGYQTQKPVTLLDRIITASSEPGDVVLDAFCGCGSAIASAEGLKRRWIGIDIAQPAIVVIKQQRLKKISESTYEVIGEPVSVPDAEALAKQDAYDFQWWALGLVDSRPIEKKKGSDKGIDGRLTFHDDRGNTKDVILSVKSGHLQAQYVRDLRGVIEREKAAIGVLISLEHPTNSMRNEAASAGFYSAPWGRKQYPRMQLITIEELLSGTLIDMPRDEAVNVTFKKAPRRAASPDEQGELFRKQYEAPTLRPPKKEPAREQREIAKQKRRFK